jgi:hypothetical protein
MYTTTIKAIDSLANPTLTRYLTNTNGVFAYSTAIPVFGTPNSVVLTNSTSGVNYATFPADDGMFGYYNGAAQFCRKT